MYMDCMLQTAEKSGEHCNRHLATVRQVTTITEIAIKETSAQIIPQIVEKTRSQLIEKYGAEPAKTFLLGQQHSFEQIISLLEFANNHPNLVKVVRVCNKFGLVGPIISLLIDIARGDSSGVILGNFIQNILKAASGTVLAGIYAQIGAIAGTSVFPGVGTVIGGFIGGIFGYTVGSFSVQILLKIILIN